MAAVHVHWDGVPASYETFLICPTLLPSIFNPLPDATQGECFDVLLTCQGCCIERIVFQKQASPPGFDDMCKRGLGSWGCALATPKGQRHRVESADAAASTI
ncbi:MAG: hypothetical protein B7Y40_07460 [Gammaproteobacteria bacterium 28-57-27]|nr:MAG: hypothetical protein B7Y40_07460 [Gammaproteobacteria bacterium 28-57-27]